MLTRGSRCDSPRTWSANSSLILSPTGPCQSSVSITTIKLLTPPVEGGRNCSLDSFLQAPSAINARAMPSRIGFFMLSIYEEQSHNLSFVPGFRLLPLIPFHSRKFSTEIPGYFLEMVQRESPERTVCSLEPSVTAWVELGFGLLGAT